MDSEGYSFQSGDKIKGVSLLVKKGRGIKARYKIVSDQFGFVQTIYFSGEIDGKTAEERAEIEYKKLTNYGTRKASTEI